MEEKSNDSTNEPKKEIKRLKRSSKNKYIFGVCGGIAEFFEIDASIIRILWVMSIFLGGLGLVLYLASALIMPKSEEETETSDNKSIDNNRAGLLVGSLLIFLGFIFLLGQLKFFNIHFNIWRLKHLIFLPWGFIWSIVLILLGLFFVIRRPKREKIIQKVKSKNIYRSKTNRKISGVCGGIGEHLNIDPTIIRILWVLMTIFSGVFLGIIVYFIFAIIIPEEQLQENQS